MKKVSQKRELRRKKNDRVILGVAAGLSDYFQIDPVLVRLVLIMLAIWGGSGILIYFILAVIMPDENAEKEDNQNRINKIAKETGDKIREIGVGWDSKDSRYQTLRIGVGGFLIIMGLSRLFELFFPFWWNTDLLGPLLLVGVGLWLVLKS